MSELWSKEHEMAVLGSAFLGGYDEAAALLRVDDFFAAPHQVIWDCLGKLSRQGHQVDALSLKKTLGARLEEVGGHDYLVNLMEFVPSTANTKFYAEQVKEFAERRRTIAAAQELARKAADQECGLEEIRALRSSLSDIESAAGVPFKSFSLVPLRTEARRGVSTGFDSLDAAISTGGYPAGQMTIVSAYQKTGKTSYKLSSFVRQCAAGMRVVFATFADLSAEDLKERQVRNLCGWSRPPSSMGPLADYDAAVRMVDIDFSSYVYDASRLDSGDDIETFVAWFKAEHKRRPFDCVFMDYAQKIVSSDRRATNDLSVAATVSRKICRVAAHTGVPFVVGAQITEGNVKEARKAITKGSRVWEEDAGWVLRITPEKDIEIAYSRFGEQGMTVPMQWNKTHLRFEERDA